MNKSKTKTIKSYSYCERYGSGAKCFEYSTKKTKHNTYRDKWKIEKILLKVIHPNGRNGNGKEKCDRKHESVRYGRDEEEEEKAK